MADEITKPHILAVEGREEELFFQALINHLGLQQIEIKGIAGKTNLRPRLKALASTPGFDQVTFLGVVRDANADPNAAFRSVRDALQAANLPAPERPLSPAGQSPRVTVMILPEQGTQGMLEDLCLRAVAQNPAMPCVERYIQCLQQQGLPLPHNLSKAKVQVFLGSRPEAGKRLGEAALAGYWPWDDRAFEQVKSFLQQFGSPT